MKNTLLVFLLFISFFSQAQNYNCLQPGARPYFTNGDGYLRSMRIDSVRTTGTDTIFYPYHTPRGNYIPRVMLLDSTGGSWLGKKVIKQPTGTFLFDNIWLDTVVIKTQAAIGDSWIFFKDTTNNSYKATITAIDTMTISGVTDSVKAITIESDSSGVINSSDSVNKFQIILSKNHGFVQVFDLYTFPYHKPERADSFNIKRQFFDYYLDLILGYVGIWDAILYSPLDNFPDSTNSIFHLVQFYDPLLTDVYNYSVGEILEFKDDRNYSPSAYGSDITLDTILSKTIGVSSVVYSMAERHLQTITSCCPVTTTTSSYGIYSRSYDRSLLIDTTILPEEWRSNYFYHYYPQNLPDTAEKCPLPPYVVDFNNIDYTSKQVLFEASGFGAKIGNFTSAYSIGYGISAISANDYTHSTSEIGAYTYIGNADSICGTFIPLPLSVVQINSPFSLLELFPNPAHNHLSVSASETINEVSITNILGQTLYTNKDCNTDKLHIDISTFPPGVYLIKLNNNEMRKFVKE